MHANTSIHCRPDASAFVACMTTPQSEVLVEMFGQTSVTDRAAIADRAGVIGVFFLEEHGDGDTFGPALCTDPPARGGDEREPHSVTTCSEISHAMMRRPSHSENPASTSAS